jgi:hypothetical protein
VFTFSKKKDGPMKTKMVSTHRRRHFQPTTSLFLFGGDSAPYRLGHTQHTVIF